MEQQVSEGISPRRIEEVAKDAQAALSEVAEKVKKEKVDKSKYAPEQALETLKFATTLMTIPSVKEFIIRRGGEGIPIVTTREYLWTHIVPDTLKLVAILPNENVHFFSQNLSFFEGTFNLKNIPDILRKNWDKGNSQDKSVINKLSKLSKRDVVEKFQKSIKT